MASQNTGANVCLPMPAQYLRILTIFRCDAEPSALGEYILALLKHNVSEQEMRKELTSQLDEFLEKGTPRDLLPWST